MSTLQGSVRAFEGALSASAGLAPVDSQAGLAFFGCAIVEHGALTLGGP